jgi:potassium efflux system protein
MIFLCRFIKLLASGNAFGRATLFDSYLNQVFGHFSKAIRKILLLLGFVVAGLVAFAQNDSINYRLDSINVPEIKAKITIDSVQEKLQKAFEKSVRKNLETFENDKKMAQQAKFFAELKIELENTRQYLLKGIDSADIDREINNIKKWYNVADDGVFTNKGTRQTSRNLTITNIILKESIKRLDARFEETSKYLGELNRHKHRIDSLLTDSALLKIPKDSAALSSFFDNAVRLGTDLGKVYGKLKNTIYSVQELNAKCQVVHNSLSIKLEEVEGYRKNLSLNAFKREFSNIWGPLGFVRPMSEILEISVQKNLIVMGFYLRNHLSTILFMVLLTIALSFFLKYLEKTGSQRMAGTWEGALHEVLSKPWLISIFIMLNIFQFFFKNPPFLFYASGWFLSSAILTVLFWKKIDKTLRLPWSLLLSLFMVTILLNSILQASRLERWVLLAVAILILVSAVISVKRFNQQDTKNRFLSIFVSLVIILEFLSIICNIFGRYNMAKTALTSGLFNLVIAILLLWTCHYIYEILKIISNVFQFRKENELETPIYMAPKGLLNFPVFLKILLFAGWFILFMRNFYAFTVFTEPFRDFMETGRTLGAYTFSIKSIFNFFLIMYCATMLSRVVSFFASDVQQNTDGKKGLGSWLLLVRITIFSIAMFLAFAAAGIAMDKIAIIFSALSVGIGFGLQTLVNNLVSGLIIAFEKPVNVGDSVDINGQSGIMKSIGFRSSVVSTFDGSDVIIPNGDLLNAHLINWTLGDTKRRVEVLVGVAYGTDIEKVKGILLKIVNADERILIVPGPNILVKEFGASSIDFRVLIWIDSAYHLWSKVKSDILEQIDIQFKKEGIEIPFAQQDINIKSIVQPGNLNKPEQDRGNYASEESETEKEQEPAPPPAD